MKTSNAPLALLLVLAIAGPIGCAGSPSPAADLTLAKANVPRASADPAAAKDAGSAINAFGLNLYQRIAAGTGNIVVSPASIALALGMARAGAKGVTAAEMDVVLRNLATDEHAASLNALDAAFGSRTGTFKDQSGKDQPVTLRIANSTFSQKGMKLQDTYLTALAARYGAGVRLVDYKADPEAARTLINGWVSEQTEKRIPELLVKGVITPDARLTLVNAIYLKAAWLTPFEVSQTKDGSFSRLDGSSVSVPFMSSIGELTYAEGRGWRAVELPYVGGSLAMTLIMPDTFATFEQGLTAPLFNQITAALERRNVTLAYPKHSIESRLELEQVLAAMGMPSAFRPGVADFSGITPEEQLFISAVIHQANMDVDEKGTTAAAATAVLMRTTAMPADPVTLRLDRPFLFALRDLSTGAILFMGRVADPTA